MDGDLKELMSSWVFQKKGMINKYNADTQRGTQPVRVIHNMLVFMFGHSYPGFLEELKTQIENGKLNPKIDFVFGEEPIRHETGYHTPRVSRESRMVQLHETFLSYLWCISYSVYILYLETVDYPEINKIVGYEKYPASQAEIDLARELFEYGKSLIAYFSPWEKEKLPNPEIYQAENRNYPEQSSLFYTEAVKFILSHEYTHLKSHIDKIDDQTPESHFLTYEYEADNSAIKNALKGADKDSIYAINGGIIIGIMSMLFFSAKTSGEKHLNTEDRLTNALEQLAVEDNDLTWGLACVGLELWEQQFGLNFKRLDQLVSKKEIYYDYIRQIKNPEK